MYRIIFIISIICFSFNGYSQETIFGEWKTIDDETGEPKSIVSIYERDGKVYGRILKLFRKNGEDPDPVCTKCPENEPRAGQKIIGMEIIKGLSPDGEEFSGGTVLKPDEGKIYNCRIWLEDGKLMVRGYWGFLYRTQEWQRQ